MIRSLVLRALAALVVTTSVAGAQATTVIVVRHAEKAAAPAADPPLNAAGEARAAAFAELVRDAGIQAIISTQFLRTKGTAAPIAAKLGLSVETVDARLPQHPKLVADSILAKHRGHTVLVIGHSNTVPAIVAALGAPKPADICDDGYDNVFVVTVPASGPASVVRLHYGVATACP
ncbi:MAG: Phosphoglycerate mutase [Gemmatimonadetes bacterium]|nr:Phosphoglycerate mutase [Gemmatimonadota bacterium]